MKKAEFCRCPHPAHEKLCGSEATHTVNGVPVCLTCATDHKREPNPTPIKTDA